MTSSSDDKEPICECGHRESYHQHAGCAGLFEIAPFEGFRECTCIKFEESKHETVL